MKKSRHTHAKSRKNVTRAEDLWWRRRITGGSERRLLKTPLTDRGRKEAELENHRADVWEQATTAAAAEENRSSVKGSARMPSKTEGQLAASGDTGADSARWEGRLIDPPLPPPAGVRQVSQENELSKHQQARKPLGHLLWQMVKTGEEALEAGRAQELQVAAATIRCWGKGNGGLSGSGGVKMSAASKGDPFIWLQKALLSVFARPLNKTAAARTLEVAGTKALQMAARPGTSPRFKQRHRQNSKGEF